MISIENLNPRRRQEFVTKHGELDADSTQGLAKNI